jgi:hypothetical protein
MAYDARRSSSVPKNATFAQDRDFGDESDYGVPTTDVGRQGPPSRVAALPRNEQFGFTQDRDPGDETVH